MAQKLPDTWDLGALRVHGACYHGASPAFFTEVLGNVLVNSDGIALENVKPRASQSGCAGYNDNGVGYLQWVVARRNVVTGISAAALNLSATQPPCGYISTTSPGKIFATDVIAEHNVFDCPRPGVLPYNGTNLPFCSSCIDR